MSGISYTPAALCSFYHVPTLYGIPIPAGATQVEVRPILGRGQSRILFRGPVEQDGVFITEDDIADQVASHASFWEYLDAQVRTGRVPAQQDSPKGCWKFRLSVSFQDQTGAPASLDEQGNTSRVTAEYFEFFRGPLRGEKTSPLETALVSLATSMVELTKSKVESESKVAQLVSQALTQSLQAVVPALACAAKDASMVALVEKQLAHENQRADKATDAVLRMLKDKQESGDTFDDLAKLASFGATALNLIRTAKGVVN